MNLICVIPAKGTSERISGKNLKRFAGQPIIKYSLDAVRESGLFTRIVVSSDSDEIGAFASYYDAVYHKRDPELCRDDTPMVDVIIDVLGQEKWDAVCMVYPCAPFIKAANIRKGFNMLDAADGTIAVFRDDNHAERAMLIDGDRVKSRYPEYDNINSNAWPDTYQSAGQFYWARPDPLATHRTWMLPNMRPVVIPEAEAIDIDTPADWDKAELLYKAMKCGDDLGWLEDHASVIKSLRYVEQQGHGAVRVCYADGKWQRADVETTRRVKL